MLTIHEDSRLLQNERTVPVEFFSFPGGERHVRIDTDYLPDWAECCTITKNITSSNDIMDVLLLTDAIRRYYEAPFNVRLVCPYFPYARQDRVAMMGEPLSAAVMANLLNSQNYSSVEIWDPHSDVTRALIHNVRFIEAEDFLEGHLSTNGWTPTLVAPDAGAAKRVAKIAMGAGLPYIQAEKKRDVKTGKITETVVHDLDKHEGPYLIVDDICDGGRTFIEISKYIKRLHGYLNRKAPEINLYITHGIFSQGIDVLREHFDSIYVANPFIKIPEDGFVIQVHAS